MFENTGLKTCYVATPNVDKKGLFTSFSKTMKQTQEKKKNDKKARKLEIEKGRFEEGIWKNEVQTQ